MWVGVRERVLAVAGRASGEDFADAGLLCPLEDPLSEDELVRLEKQIGAPLPAEYRGFLRHVGAGGPGPAYGVFPVRLVDGVWAWEGDGADRITASRLSDPFPAASDAESVARLLVEYPDPDDFEDGFENEAYEPAYDAWTDRWHDIAWAPERTVGAVVIADRGCALNDWLVLAGPERGRIWVDDRVDHADLRPRVDEAGEPVGFARWYLSWLAETEQRLLIGTDPRDAAS